MHALGRAVSVPRVLRAERNAASAEIPHVVFIYGRDYRQSYYGRSTIVTNYMNYLQQRATITIVVLKTVLNSQSPAIWAEFACRAILYVLRIYRRPLQVALYDNNHNKQLVQHATTGEWSTALFDGVRLSCLIPYVNAHGRVVMDLDDLMSRRYAAYSKHAPRLVVGRLGRRFAFAAKLLPAPLAKVIMRREAALLADEESRVGDLCNKIIFTSKVELEVFRERNQTCLAELHSQVLVATPQNSAGAKDVAPDSRPRFGFIGSDEMLQNSTTIEWLLSAWGSNRFDADLLIAGRQSRDWRLPQGCLHVGYVEDVAEFYSRIDCLLAPSFIPGGVKTKAVEAFSYGCAVAGNATLFEAIDIPAEYPLIFFALSDLVAFLHNDRNRIARAIATARDAIPDILRQFSPDKFERLMQLTFLNNRSPEVQLHDRHSA